MIANFERIKSFLEFQDKNDFYAVQIFQRRKDTGNEKMKMNVKRLKVFYIHSLQEFDELQNRIIDICKANNARAYIRLHRLNKINVSLSAISEISKRISENLNERKEGNLYRIQKVYDDVIGRLGGTPLFRTLIDIDKEHIENYHKDTGLVEDMKISIKNHLLQDRKLNENEFEITENLTNSGVHILISVGFDKRILNDFQDYFVQKGMPKVQIQKDINTLLYYPGK